jgi:Sulfotransferase family
VGAPRAGTTSLYEYLKRVQGIYLPDLKEPHYFASNMPDGLFRINVPRVRNEREYLNLYEKVKNEVAIGDASATYLWDKESPKLIHDALPEARIIMILRDPIERAFSHYLLHLRDGSETRLSFHDALISDYQVELEEGASSSHLYVGYGMYSEQVKRYLDIFGRDRVKILIFEEFVQDARDSVCNILQFLGIKDTTSLPDNIGNPYNAFSVPRFRYLPRVINRLANPKFKQRELNKRLTLEKLRSSNTNVRDIANKILFKRSHKPELPDGSRLFIDAFHLDVIKLRHILRRTLPWPLVGNH